MVRVELWFEDYIRNRTQFVTIGKLLLVEYHEDQPWVQYNSCFISMMSNCSDELYLRIFADDTNMFLQVLTHNTLNLL